MTVVVGFGPESRGRGALELGRLLAESSRVPLVVCCAILDRWGPVGQGRRVDFEYQDHLQALATETLRRADDVLGTTMVPVVRHVATGRSVPGALIDAAREHEATVLVAGSSSDGAWGHIVLGSVTDRLLHSSPVPVAVAPRGLRLKAEARVRRVTVAVDGTAASFRVLEQAASVAHDIGAALRVVSFAVRPRPMIPPELGLRVEERVVTEWRRQTRQLMAEGVQRLGGPAAEAELRVVDASSWAEALDAPEWAADDVLVVGSSTSESAFRRVFIGATATRIIRHSPVSVIVVP